jgi:hypothetical protein
MLNFLDKASSMALSRIIHLIDQQAMGHVALFQHFFKWHLKTFTKHF